VTAGPENSVFFMKNANSVFFQAPKLVSDKKLVYLSMHEIKELLQMSFQADLMILISIPVKLKIR